MLHQIPLFFYLASALQVTSPWQLQIIKDAEFLYSPVSLREYKKPIEFVITDSPVVSANADHEHDKLTINIYSGLLKSSRLTPDSFRMIICHELGHLFGGAPRKSLPMEWVGPIGNDGKSLMSAEGQADYYASSVCFKKMLELENKNTPYKFDLERVGPVLKYKCQVTAGFNGASLESCYRSALAGLDFLTLVADFPISCEDTDSDIVETTNSESYPGRQCRLDTIVNGTLCKNTLPIFMNEYDDSKNSCMDLYAQRPQCWYK